MKLNYKLFVIITRIIVALYNYVNYVHATLNCKLGKDSVLMWQEKYVTALYVHQIRQEMSTTYCLIVNILLS